MNLPLYGNVRRVIKKRGEKKYEKKTDSSNDVGNYDITDGRLLHESRMAGRDLYNAKDLRKM